MPTPTHRSARGDTLDLSEGWLSVVSTRHHDPRRDVPHERNAPLDLVLFDMDGTLIQESSWEMVHAAFGVSNEANWQRYQKGELDDVAFMRSDIAMWLTDRRVHVREVEEVLEKAHVFEGAEQVVRALKEQHVATCILSGGIDILARRVCERLDIDMFVANGLRLEESGHLQGDGLPLVQINDKSRTTRDILARLDVAPARAAAVGNSAYDVPMFRECAFGVAFNPSDEFVRRHARHVVPGPDMRPVAHHLLEGAR